jgi:hypothetical protein
MPPNKEVCDVLHDDVPGSKLANQTGVLRPKTRARSFDADTWPGAADVLAGEAAGKDMHPRCSGEFANVGVARHSGPVLSEHPLAEPLRFAEPVGAETAGSLEAEVKTADA